jgi:ubiquinone/menaquinone biosynthesis C-methylase UbiE
MDLPQPRSALEDCLRDIARVNRLLGVHRMMLKLFAAFIRPGDRVVSMVDVATGQGDLPRLYVRWAAARGIHLEAVAIDNHPITAAVARDSSHRVPQIHVVVGEAQALPLADASVDLAVLTTSLHHLELPEAVRAIRELDRVSRRGFIVTDLVRSWGAYVGARLLALTVLRHPIARADGPLSVLRAYTTAEAHNLVRLAGVKGVKIFRRPLFRLAMRRMKHGS